LRNSGDAPNSTSSTAAQQASRIIRRVATSTRTVCDWFRVFDGDKINVAFPILG